MNCLLIILIPIHIWVCVCERHASQKPAINKADKYVKYPLSTKQCYKLAKNKADTDV